MNEEELRDHVERLIFDMPRGRKATTGRIMQLFSDYSAQLVREAEIKVHERYETVPVKNLRAHMTARKNILLAQLTEQEKDHE